MLNTITQIKTANGKVIDIVDWTDKPLFSTADFLTGFTQQSVSLFQYVSGDPVPGVGTGAVTRRTSTDRETNIATQGAMASTEEMLVYSVNTECYFFATDDQTPNDFTTRTHLGADALALPQAPLPSQSGLSLLNAQLLLRLVISQKDYVNDGLGAFSAGYGPFGLGASFNANTGAARAVGNNGLPSAEAVRSFVIPHHIGSQEKYRVDVVNAGGAACNFSFDEGTTEDDGPAVIANTLLTLVVKLSGLYKRPTA